MTNEIIYQWYEYQRDVGDIIQCSDCHKWIPWDEYAVNYGVCTECMDRSFEEYLKNENQK